MNSTSNVFRHRAHLWLALSAAVGVSLVLLYPDSFQQDGGYHFLYARWAWREPEFFVGVWARPLFTFVYAFPALLGFQAARLLSVGVAVMTAWQTWRLAEDAGLKRAELAVPLLFLQPSFFILCPDLLTEPLFALVFVIALRLHWRGRLRSGMLAASLLVMARPEGFFVGLLWGIWILADRRSGATLWRRMPATLLLATGAFIWWAAAFAISKDPLFIIHNWPREWAADGSYGQGDFWIYALRAPEVVGIFTLAPFVYGLTHLLKRRALGTFTSSFLLLFGLHSLFRAFGLFNDAGYPRYLVCVAPAIALITLVGWNLLAHRFAHYSPAARLAWTTTLLGLSLIICALYMDGLIWARDARAVSDSYSWFRAHERPVSRLIWSEAYMCVVFNHNPLEKPPFTSNREQNLALLRESPHGTLIFWDEIIGPKWVKVDDRDLESLGYQRLHSESYHLTGWLFRNLPLRMVGPRQQRMHLFYRE